MNFGKEVIVGSLITLFSVVIFSYYLVTYKQFSNKTFTPGSNTQTTNSNQPTGLGNSNGLLNLTAAELAKHNTPDDCWIVIYNKVLKITPYLNLHPGGTGSITTYCGQDATSAFDTKGGKGRGHSPYAISLLERFVIGLFGQEINPAVLNQPIDTTNIINTKRELEID